MPFSGTFNEVFCISYSEIHYQLNVVATAASEDQYCFVGQPEVSLPRLLQQQFAEAEVLYGEPNLDN